MEGDNENARRTSRALGRNTDNGRLDGDGNSGGSSGSSSERPNPSETNGGIGTSGNNQIIDGLGDGVSGHVSGNADTSRGSGNVENGSGRSRLSPEQRIANRNQRRRERYAESVGKQAETVKQVQTSTERDIVDSEEDSSGGFSITVENPIMEVPLLGSKAPTTIKPGKSRKNASGKGIKTPEKGNVDIIASSMQDVYNVIDAGLNITLTMMDKEYPEGLFKLDDAKAQKMAYAMAQMNNTFGALAARINNVSAPATLAAILLTDLSTKGMMLYAVLKSQKSNPANS